MVKDITQILEKAAGRHTKLCPRIVLGVRIGLAGAAAIGLEVPRNDKRLLGFVETDGCFMSGVEAATGCSANHRTLRIEDYGKAAGTFVNLKTGQAVRVAPRIGVRQLALDYAPEVDRPYFGMLLGYQRMPLDELLTIEEVHISTPVASIVSRPGVRANCDRCAEEIINEREIFQDGLTLCRSCAEPAYYQTLQNNQLNADLVFSHQLSSGVRQK
ncbi:MAG TPA: formylmethanofuran dehydrogenase [Chloroflexi bacterium]|nr:formylmethanofuran dehydrogenase [Chloroflexota bacterium]